MKRSDWLGGLRTTLGLAPRRRVLRVKRRVPSVRRATFEVLEDRRLLATLTVNTWLDNVVAGDGLVTLREAIIAANTNTATDLGQSGSGADTIQFDASLSGGTIPLALGELGITEAVTIDATSLAGGLTIDAQENSRIFNITDATRLGDFTFSGLTLTGGRTTGDGGGIYIYGDVTLLNSTISGNSALGDGGGIYIYGDVTLLNSTISGNSAFGGRGGGGILAAGHGGDVTVTNSTISGNSASGSGGGIDAETSVSVNVTNSTVSDNSARFGGGIFSRGLSDVNVTNSTVSGNSALGEGGGILAEEDSVHVIDSTVSGNSALGEGGGIWIFGDVTLLNSTISGNSAFGSGRGGGGIFASGSVTMTGSTISGNSTDGDGGGIGGIFGDNHPLIVIDSTVSDNIASGSGGGIDWLPTESFYLGSITNSIVAGNSDSGSSPDLNPGTWGSLTVEYSFIGDTTGTGITAGTGTGNILDANPMLGPLADNGGPTKTHALLAGSPAINAGDPAAVAGVGGVPLYDQRGDPWCRVVGGRLDIGAVESHLGPVITSADTADVPENTTAVLTVTATDADLPAQAVTFSITGGADQAKFAITSGGGLAFSAAPDFEVPTDANHDNVYVVIVQASDGGRTALQAILVTVTNGNELLACDYNLNGIVDAADYTVWRDTLGRSVTPFSGADGSGNGIIDTADCDLWKADFGHTTAAAGSGSAAPADTMSSASVAKAQTAPAKSVTPASQPVVVPVAKAVRLPSLATDAVIQMATLRSDRPRLAKRDLPAVVVSQDQALLAWLASRSGGARRDWAAADYADLRSEPDRPDAPNQLVDSFDQAFESLTV